MKAGDIVLLPMPGSTLAPGKIRPVLLLSEMPGRHGDWLFCGISSQLSEAVPDWDDVLQATAAEFPSSGLKVASVIRLNWLGTVSPYLAGSAPRLGEVSTARVERLLNRLASHLRK